MEDRKTNKKGFTFLFMISLFSLLLGSHHVAAHDALGYPLEQESYHGDCITCVMSGHLYCNPTQLCYHNWGSILGKDCTQVDKVHTLEFLDTDDADKWFNNVFTC